MEVKPHYKQTEVGVIPQEWDVCKLGNLVDYTKGYAFRSAEYVSDGVRVVRVSDTSYDAILDDNPVFVSERKAHQYARWRLKTNDVVVSTVGSKPPMYDSMVGKVILISPRNEGALLNQNAVLVRDRKRREHIQHILLSHFRSKRYLLWIESIYRGNANQASITLKELFEFPIPLPSSESEQRAIAQAFSHVDGLLGGLDRLIAKKRDVKQAAMQHLLTGQTRLPGFAPPNSQLTKTPVGDFPEDWKLTQLSDLVDPARSIRYGIVQPGDYDPQGRYMIRGQDYSEVKGWAAPSEVFRVSAGIEERYRNARVKTGDLIITIVGYCGHVEMVPEWLDGANLTQTTARIAIQPQKAISSYCKYALLSPIGRNQVAAYVKGAAQPGLNCGDVEKFLLPLPNVREQAAISEVLTDIDAELATLDLRREKTRALKQAVMQELLTGKTRLV